MITRVYILEVFLNPNLLGYVQNRIETGGFGNVRVNAMYKYFTH